jgi:sugar (pentulose or hexulose) kinase
VTAPIAQVLADATGRRVRLHTDEPDQAAIGAARLAADALGAPLPGRGGGGVELRPNRAAARMWQELSERQDAARATLFGPARDDNATRGRD